MAVEQCALSTMSGSGRQCFAGGHGQPPQCYCDTSDLARGGAACLQGHPQTRHPEGGPLSLQVGMIQLPLCGIHCNPFRSEPATCSWLAHLTDVSSPDLYQAVLVSL